MKKRRDMACRGIFAALAGMLVMACSGCGGGGGGSAPPAPAPKAVHVLLVGDSTTQGLVKNPDGSYSITGAPATDLQADLQAPLGSSVTVATDALAGTTLLDLLNGNGFSQPLAQRLATDPSNIVIESFGANDAARYTTAEFQQALQQFVTQVTQAGKIAVLEEPNPVCIASTGQEWVYSNGLTLGPYVAVIDAVAQASNMPLVKQYEAIKAMPGWCSMMSDEMGQPSLALYGIKAQSEAAVLAPIVKALQ